MESVSLDKLVSLCKRRGFIYPSAEIYGGLNGIYDTGPLGVLMKNHIRTQWLHNIHQVARQLQSEVVQIDGALIGPQALWKASGHIDNFHDPLVDCLTCKHRFRADDISLTKPCPNCGNTTWTDVRDFNLMFTTQLGAAKDASTTAYLRPETAQTVFANFKNVYSTMRVKIPFGIAQIGKAFRNEITPKQFLFRMREFEQMEIEWFCKPQDADRFFDAWSTARRDFYSTIGINPEHIRLRAYEKHELSHYSSGTYDVEYQYTFGWKELEGIANRTQFDLTQHMTHSGKDLKVYDDETKESFVPAVVECSVGVDRLFLTLLHEAYAEETVAEGDVRTVLRLHPKIAPILVTVLPLSKQLEESTFALYQKLSQAFPTYKVTYDPSGSVGKRYRRADEIGTPFCITYDFDSVQDGQVTVRDRDTMRQERIAQQDLVSWIAQKIS